MSTLHRFPVVGANFNTAQNAHTQGSVLGLVIGLLGLLYGAQGLTQCAQQAMAAAWNVPRYQRAGLAPRLARSLVGLVTIGGAFGSVIGILAFLLLQGKLSLYAAELNPVLARGLYPRARPLAAPTEADHRVLRDLVYQEQRRKDQSIGVGFGPNSPDEAARDARRQASRAGFRSYAERVARTATTAKLRPPILTGTQR